MRRISILAVVVLFISALWIRTGPVPADLRGLAEEQAKEKYSFSGSNIELIETKYTGLDQFMGEKSLESFAEEEHFGPREINSQNFNKEDNQVEDSQENKYEIRTHKVKSGENLWTIARKYDISINTLIGANDIKNMNDIRPGDELSILPVDGIKYNIGPGDCPQEVIEKYRVDSEKLKKYNDIKTIELLDSGDSLILPGAEPEFGYQDRLNQRFIRPVDGRISSPFGPRWGSHHDGKDYAVPQGTPVKAAGGGRVVHVSYTGGYGKTIIIEHQDGIKTLYGHLSSYRVRRGQRVNRGQIIGESGNTGRSTGPHLHFEVRVNGRPVNPANYLRD
ncbi:M23 family metallopeptidase [Halarsenatibacter silvermanii]|uniref:Murein DD-endopeptidase MepM and murein hydrolase activator NlpD, contain LysM domain n=1 Tax=Halarsenatibacter silvermanii TaxID=321763 RepID=A0A1G9P7E4_9FIRM|nr:M23 family metallopeptidase [Halarsenatibacter silvermanii]SDL94634.1 Murein DD-endopeptidase MepM and murein hydrolase activator NlpD, contain LysM domain [Halarsenatibacter silvermanii]